MELLIDFSFLFEDEKLSEQGLYFLNKYEKYI
jgi:hypothetical protein